MASLIKSLSVWTLCLHAVCYPVVIFVYNLSSLLANKDMFDFDIFFVLSKGDPTQCAQATAFSRGTVNTGCIASYTDLIYELHVLLSK